MNFTIIFKISNKNHNFNEMIDKVICDIIKNSLLLQEDELIISVEAINYIEESLTDEDKLAYHHYFCRHVNQLMMCNSDSIMVACQAILAMINLLKQNIGQFTKISY